MGLVRKLILIVVFLALMVGGWQFAALNSEMIQIHYLAGSLEGVVVWAALLGSFAAGAAGMAAISGFRVLRVQMTARRYKKLVAGLEAEVHQLRNLPLSMEDPAEKNATLPRQLGAPLDQEG